MKKHIIHIAALSLGIAGAAVVGLADDPPAQESALARRLAARAPHWAYQPVQRPTVPTVQQKDWPITPIDAFVLAKLEEAGIEPSPDADRATFIRRASLDVLGVIPSPEEVEAFVNDTSPDAYERLVDRLLASPGYGVRQARRWLDLARYADSTGFQGDQTRADMWRYRDYVVDAFNEDKPFDLFIKEQLAGDELAPDDPEALIATGFMAGYPDNRNSRDLLGRKYEITTDIVDTVGQAMLGQTVQCARCHDHKFDPISQKEYFQLQAFFANVIEQKEIPAPVGPVEREYKAAMQRWEEATKDVRARIAALIEPILDESTVYQKQRYLIDSQESLFKPESEWTAVDRWVNARWRNVTAGSDYEVDRYLRETAEAELAETGEVNREKLALLEEYRKLKEELASYDHLKPVTGSDTITAMTEIGHPDAPPTFVLFGGDRERPLEEVEPDFPAAIAHGAKPEIEPSATSSGRRTALASWIASEENPLTARVFVNRVWAQYFGRGIVETTSNFGTAGTPPTHPELLDYLADAFVSNGWSVKAVHREILLSRVYRQSSDYREEVYAADPSNELLAVFPRRRLEAEQIRDSLLAASGLLNDELGGPSVLPPLPDTLKPGNRWRVSRNAEDHNRRSLYVFTRRSLPYPMLNAFDMASPQEVHSERKVTTSPLQALTLYNDELVFEWSKALAGRVLREAPESESAQFDRLYEILFARRPDDIERDTLRTFLDEQEKLIASQASEGSAEIHTPTGVEGPLPNPVRAAAFVDVVHAVANSNEFAYRF